MKDYIANRVFQILTVVPLLGVFVLSFGKADMTRNSISDMKGKNSAFAQEKPSSPVNDDASPGQEKGKEEFFPGRNIKVEDAVRKAPLIIVGKIVDAGVRGIDSPDKVTYGLVKVEVLQILKGYVSKELSLSFDVHSYPPEMKEKAPEVGQRYIIFINEKAVITALKFLPDTQEQRWRITELVSSVVSEHR